MMKQILENLQNWQTEKKDKSAIASILKIADYFDINYPNADGSASYHFYPALELVKGEKEDVTQLIMYMISKKRDTKAFLDTYKGDWNEVIRKFTVINTPFGEGKGEDDDTKISEKEAMERKMRWSKEIGAWVEKNEVFDVFDLPMEDFNFKDSSITMQGHFGMKEVKVEEGTTFTEVKSSPDLIILQTNMQLKSQAYFDMAKLSPPFKNTQYQEEFALLQYKM